jgi:hypothetical protein
MKVKKIEAEFWLIFLSSRMRISSLKLAILNELFHDRLWFLKISADSVSLALEYTTAPSMHNNFC